MIPEEMYQTLDETSLEHWVMELPEDEAGCGWISEPCAKPVAWLEVFRPCGHNTMLCTHHRDILVATKPPLDHLGLCGICWQRLSDVDFIPA